MNRISIPVAIVLFFGVFLFDTNIFAEKMRPNVVIILADDLGIGDTGCYGATVLKTPNIDSLAEHGLRFTQGYATSSTCTPSRFALMTGLYPIRNSRAAILPGNAPLLVDPNGPTLPKVFKNAGYRTLAVGKWHLGLADGRQDWNREIRPGPNEIGFDRSFIFAATNDRAPTVYIEDQKVVGLDPADPLFVDYRTNFEGEPTGKTHPELMYKMKPAHGHADSVHNGIGRIGFQKGGKSAYWVDEDMADVFSAKALEYVRHSVKDRQPFFLYYALHQPHAPRVPNMRFAGATPLGPRGDVIAEMDWQVGELLKLLRELGQEENTIVIFTSDNGMVVGDGYIDQSIVLNQKTGHTPGGILRGGKYTRYDGGMHVPLIVRWKGTIKPGLSDALVCQIDFLASFAEMLGEKPPQHVDSQNILAAFLGKAEQGRTELVLEAGRQLSFRDERRFLIPAQKEGQNRSMRKAELYDLVDDPSQKNDLAEKQPEIVEKMTKRLEEIVQSQP